MSAIRLPPSLLKKIDRSAGANTTLWPHSSELNHILPGENHSHQKKTSRQKVSRKESRKQERVEQKKRKAEFFSVTPSCSKPRTVEPEEHFDSPKRKKPKSVRSQAATVDDAPLPLPSRSQREEDEDSYIAYLESKLGYKSGKRAKGIPEDGLDGLRVFP